MAPEDAAPPAGPRWHWAGWLLGLLALAGVVLVSARLGELEQFLRLLRSIALSWLLLALILQSGTYLMVAAAWRQGLRAAGVRRSLRALAPLALGKLFLDQSLPSAGVSGTGYVVSALVRQGLPAPACLSAMLANLVGRAGACLVAASLAVLHLGRVGALAPWVQGLGCIFALVTLAVPAVMLALRRLRQAPGWLLRRLPALAAMLEPLARAPLNALRSPGSFLSMVGLNLALIGLDAATLWVMLRALGVEAGYPAAFCALMAANMAATVAPVPMGLGGFEAACVAVQVALAIPVEAALTATLLLRGCTTWLPMLPGMMQVRGEMRARRAAGLSGGGA